MRHPALFVASNGIVLAEHHGVAYFRERQGAPIQLVYPLSACVLAAEAPSLTMRPDEAYERAVARDDQMPKEVRDRLHIAIGEWRRPTPRQVEDAKVAANIASAFLAQEPV